MHARFWDIFTERLRERLGPAAAEKILFGEIYDGNPAHLGQYTWRTDRRNRLAQGLLMTLPGIPCLYYGTEFALLDDEGKVGEDGETGRRMFFRQRGGPSMSEVKSSPAFKEISNLAAIRASLPVLRTGGVIPLWVDNESSEDDDGVFAFGRASEDGSSFAVIVVNASDSDRVTASGEDWLQLPANLKTEGKVLRPVLTIGQEKAASKKVFDAAGPLRLPVPASSLVVYEAVDKR